VSVGFVSRPYCVVVIDRRLSCVISRNAGCSWLVVADAMFIDSGGLGLCLAGKRHTPHLRGWGHWLVRSCISGQLWSLCICHVCPVADAEISLACLGYHSTSCVPTGLRMQIKIKTWDSGWGSDFVSGVFFGNRQLPRTLLGYGGRVRFGTGC